MYVCYGSRAQLSAKRKNEVYVYVPVLSVWIFRCSFQSCSFMSHTTSTEFLPEVKGAKSVDPTPPAEAHAFFGLTVVILSPHPVRKSWIHHRVITIAYFKKKFDTNYALF